MKLEKLHCPDCDGEIKYIGEGRGYCEKCSTVYELLDDEDEAESEVAPFDIVEFIEYAGEEARKLDLTDIKIGKEACEFGISKKALDKFKTKKGARCSIEALLKRVAKGNQIGNIIPLVDIYNGISLKYGVPIGGENIDKFEGDVRLTIAEGGEDFVTYGSEGKSEPPSEGEVVYKDDFGAICRCWNWREAERTMLTEDTVNAFMIIEAHDEASAENMDAALEELKAIIEKDLGGTVSKHMATASNPEVVID